MLAAVHQLNTKENLVKVKMENEQTVPSAGFSPQPDPYESEYMTKFTHQTQQNNSNYGNILSIVEDSSYCNLADNFDLSLLGDYDDHDMATVPSPSWSPNAFLEPTSWQQMSLYAASPSGDFRAFSPDCKPALSPVHPFSNDSYQIYSPSTPGSQHDGHCDMSPTEQQQQQQMACDRHLLLRQCLEDTSFQRKYNFKPLDLPGTTSLMGENEPGSIRELGRGSPSENVNNSLELNQIEPVFSMAFEQIRSDIQNACSILAISPDPMQWSVSDVQSWLAHTRSSWPGMMMTSSGAQSGPNTMTTATTFWNLDGRSLCSFDENEFRVRDPITGDRIFAHLELWKMLQNQQKQSCSAQLPNPQAEVSNFSGANNSSNSNIITTTHNNNNVFNLEQLLLSPSLESPSSESSSTPGESQMSSHVPEMTTSNNSQGPISSPLDISTRSPSSSSNFSSPLAPEPMNTDDDDEEDEEEEKKPVVGKTKGGNTSGVKSGAHIHLWQFLKELLSSPQQHGSCIRWLDQSRGVFKIEDSVRVARLWGNRKNRPAMNYDKLSRSIRQYYRKGIMRKTERSQRLVYQFCHPYGL